MSASVTYDRVGRVKEVTRGFSTDATKTVYVYDEAGRTTEIRHETIIGRPRCGLVGIPGLSRDATLLASP